jgi:ribosomal RNA-processing protein 8
MFAVPGWSVSSSALKTQVSNVSKPQTQPPNSAESVPESSGKVNKKRKRPGGKSKSSEVTSSNLADLWETIIEKNPKQKDPIAEEKRIKKKQRQAEKLDDGAKSTQEENSTVQHDKSQSLEGSQSSEGRGHSKEKRLQPHEDNTVSRKQTTKTKQDLPTASKLTPLQIKMREKLTSARFRHLNQTLYTTPSAHSLELFKENPEMFQEYHEGFRRQVEVWPENPVDGYVAQIKQRGMQRHQSRGKSTSSTHPGNDDKDQEISPLPRTDGTCYIADLGCGDARLSQDLEKIKKKLKIQVFSYDLQSPSPVVTQADIANLPLKDGSIDVAIFCLALMGTNWIDFIEEAFRILRWKGELWIAEIKSRFGRVGGKNKRVDHSVGNRKKPTKEVAKKMEDNADQADLLVEVDGHEDNNQETDISAFVEVLRKRGFILQGENAVDLSNKMFVRMKYLKGLTPIKGKCVPIPKGMAEMGMETWKKKPKSKFIEGEEVPTSTEASVLKPCVYKLR